MSGILSESGFVPYKMNLSPLDISRSKFWPIMDMMWIHQDAQDKILDKFNEATETRQHSENKKEKASK